VALDPDLRRFANERVAISRYRLESKPVPSKNSALRIGEVWGVRARGPEPVHPVTTATDEGARPGFRVHPVTGTTAERSGGASRDAVRLLAGSPTVGALTRCTRGAPRAWGRGPIGAAVATGDASPGRP